MFDDFKSAVSGAINNAADLASSAADTIRETASNAIDSVSEGVSSAVNTVSEAAISTVEEVSVFTSNAADTVYQTLSAGYDGISAFTSASSKNDLAPVDEFSFSSGEEITYENYDNISTPVKETPVNVEANTLADDFYTIADTNAGILSVQKMQTLLDDKINSSNIISFLNDYDNKKQGDSSIIDTITSETGASSLEQKKALMSLMDKLSEAAEKAGVSKEDIQKARNDYENSMNNEFGAIFRRINPKDMEKSLDFLRGAIVSKENTGDDISSSEAISKFNANFKSENDLARKNFDEARKKDGRAENAGDNLLGLFGCNTKEDLQKKLGNNSQAVEKLMNSASETEFKQNYKEVFGIEFDKDKISAREKALERYASVKNCDSTIKLADEVLKSSNSSFEELKTELQNKFNYDETTINQILESYIQNSGEVNPDDNKKKELLMKFVSDTKENLSERLKTEANGKSLEELGKDLDLITKSTFGTSDIAKDVAQFNQNQILTGLAVEAAAEIAGTIALQFVPGLGQAAAARLAVSAAKWGNTGMKIANAANKTEKALNAVTNFQQGKVMADTAGKTAQIVNSGAKVISQTAAAGTATMAVDLSNGKTVEEAAKKALTNMAFTTAGATSNILAPKLMETFGIADKVLATEIAEQVINTAGIYGITKFEGMEYGNEQALIDFTAGLVLARLGHSAMGNNPQKVNEPNVSETPKNPEQIQKTPFKFDLQRFANGIEETAISEKDFLKSLQEFAPKGTSSRDVEYSVMFIHSEDYEKILNRVSALKELAPENTSVKELVNKADTRTSVEEFEETIKKAAAIKKIMPEDTTLEQLMNITQSTNSAEELTKQISALKEIAPEEASVKDLIWASRFIEKDLDETIMKVSSLKTVMPKETELDEMIRQANAINFDGYEETIKKISLLQKIASKETKFNDLIKTAQKAESEKFEETINKAAALKEIMPQEETSLDQLLNTASSINSEEFSQTIKKVSALKEVAPKEASVSDLINIAQSMDTAQFEETIKKISALKEISPEGTSFEEITNLAKLTDSNKYEKEKKLMQFGFSKSERELLKDIDEQLYPKVQELSKKLKPEQIVEVLRQNKSEDVINSYSLQNKNEAINKMLAHITDTNEKNLLEKFISHTLGEGKLNIEDMDLNSKIKMRGLLSRIQNSNTLSKHEKEFIEINNAVENLNHSLEYTITPSDVTKEQAVNMMKGFFANNNEKLENLIKTFDFAQYEKTGIPLAYPRSEFMSDLNAVLKNVSEDKKSEILNKLEIKLNSEQGYDGIINLNKLNSKDETEKKILEISTKFIKNNSVNTSNQELNNSINSLLQGMPEFMNIMGKQQNNTLDVNTLKVLQEAVNNPEYKNLSNIDRTCLKFAVLFQNIAKQEGVTGLNQAENSAKYAKDILRKYNLPKNVKDRIFELVENQNLLTDFKEQNIQVSTVATLLRRNGDLKISEILANANGKTIADADLKNISAEISKMNEKGQIIFSNRIINPEKIPAVEYNGQHYKVIDLNSLSSSDDLKKVGFEAGLRKYDLRFNVHMVNSFDDLEKVMHLIESTNKSLISGSYISYDVKPTYDRNLFGVSLESDNVNVASALYENQNSGFEKGFEAFDNIMHENVTTEKILQARNKMPSILKNLLGLNDKEYAELYTKLQNIEHASQLDEINEITIGNKTLEGSYVKKAIKRANDSVLADMYSNSGLKNSEVMFYAPKVNGVVAKVDKIEQIPQKILDFAQQHNLPVYILGADNEAREQLNFGVNFKL